jgi:hypothetical protein
VRILEQPGELLAFLGALTAAFMIDVFVRDGVPGIGTPSSEFHFPGHFRP